MKTYILKENHPTVKKVDEVIDLCKKLGISFNYTRAGNYMVDDLHRNESFYMTDIDRDSYDGGFPPITEYKLSHEK